MLYQDWGEIIIFNSNIAKKNKFKAFLYHMLDPKELKLFRKRCLFQAFFVQKQNKLVMSFKRFQLWNSYSKHVIVIHILSCIPSNSVEFGSSHVEQLF